MVPLYHHRYHILNKCLLEYLIKWVREVKMSELSCGTQFIGRNETLDLSRYQCISIARASAAAMHARVKKNAPLARFTQQRAHTTTSSPPRRCMLRPAVARSERRRACGHVRPAAAGRAGRGVGGRAHARVTVLLVDNVGVAAHVADVATGHRLAAL